MGLPVIQDMAVIANRELIVLIEGLPPIGRNPIGEAQKGYVATQPMTATERLATVGRLENSIYNLMEQANTQHRTAETDPDYITRLSTNEHFFCTKEPMSLAEFEVLQNKIADKARTMPSGVQLILGSFAIQNTDGKVMSVTPFITCGDPPVFHFIVKNYTSHIDVRYHIADGKGNRKTLEELDTNNCPDPMALSSITVNGIPQKFTFNNLFHCKTPGDTPFLTAVEICTDHAYGVAKKNFQLLASKNPEILNLPISHVVVSNTVDLTEKNFLVPHIMQVDPEFLPLYSRMKPEQYEGSKQTPLFGNDIFTIYNLEKCALSPAMEEIKAAPSTTAALLTELKSPDSVAEPTEFELQIRSLNQTLKPLKNTISVTETNRGADAELDFVYSKSYYISLSTFSMSKEAIQKIKDYLSGIQTYTLYEIKDVDDPMHLVISHERNKLVWRIDYPCTGNDWQTNDFKKEVEKQQNAIANMLKRIQFQENGDVLIVEALNQSSPHVVSDNSPSSTTVSDLSSNVTVSQGGVFAEHFDQSAEAFDLFITTATQFCTDCRTQVSNMTSAQSKEIALLVETLEKLLESTIPKSEQAQKEKEIDAVMKKLEPFHREIISDRRPK